MHSCHLKRIFLTIFSFIMLLYSGKTHAEQCYESDSCTGMDKCSGIKIYGEFLYWKVVQDQMQYAAVLPGGIQQIIQAFQGGDNPVQLSEKLSIIDPSFKYKPGFRIGLGYDVPCSNWDFQLAWTRIHEKVSSSVYNNEQGVIPLTFPVASIFGFINRDPSQFAFGNEAKSRWNFEFDTIDLQVGRDCSCLNCLAFRPYIGIKAASIRQNQHIEYLGFSVDGTPINLRNIKKNNFYGIGPSFGFDSSWEFYPHWNLSSGICGALLCGKFDVNEHPSANLDPNFIKVDSKNSKKCRLRPAVDANIGIDWNTCVCDRFQIMIGISYEVQYWWNQWQAPSSVESSLINGGSSPQGDLMMHGLTARLAVSF